MRLLLPSSALVSSSASAPVSRVLPEGPGSEGFSQEVTSFARTGSGGRKRAGLGIGAELGLRGWVLDPRGGTLQRSSDPVKALITRRGRAQGFRVGVWSLRVRPVKRGKA